MYEKKNNPIDRKNYYLTPEQKKEIKDYVIAHPDMPQIKIAEHFGVSRTVVYNIYNAPLKREHYEKKIEQLTTENQILHNRIAALQKQLLKNK